MELAGLSLSGLLSPFAVALDEEEGIFRLVLELLDLLNLVCILDFLMVVG